MIRYKQFLEKLEETVSEILNPIYREDEEDYIEEGKIDDFLDKRKLEKDLDDYDTEKKSKSNIKVVKGHSYGAQYKDDEEDDDENISKSKEESKEKRGRGRPAGSKSGARQKGTSGKSDSGIQVHSLRLPGNNK